MRRESERRRVYALFCSRRLRLSCLDPAIAVLFEQQSLL